MKNKIIFFGTSEFAIPSLRALMADARFEVVGVVTQPDRPVGRHAIMTAPPLKQFYADVKQPEKLFAEDFTDWLNEVGPSCAAFVVVSYGKILPKWLIDLPQRGVINVHGSLLPRWRGAAPIQAAIAAGDAMSGVTVMLIDELLDHGPIIGEVVEEILPTDTGSSLHDRLAELGGKVLPELLASYLTGKITQTEQDHQLATKCKTLSREDGKLDFSKTATELERVIRAYTPWPGTWMEMDGKRLKILTARIGKIDTAKTSGSLSMADGILLLACADGTTLELTRVQPAGKKPMSGAEYGRGYGLVGTE